MSQQEPSTFDVIPAIDLRGGRVVRLEQGDFARETTFSSAPAELVDAFAAAGARWVHVVDLDGARDGVRRQTGDIVAIVEAARGRLRIEVGGGLRDAAAIDAALAAGAARVVVGTAAIANPDLVASAVARHGRDRIAVALDVRGDEAVGAGWLADAPGRDLGSVLRDTVDAGVTTVIVTAIARDGLLGGPDLELLGRCVEGAPVDVLASGGIASIEDVLAVHSIGCRGAIVGRAIYDGRLDLGRAIAATASLDRRITERGAG